MKFKLVTVSAILLSVFLLLTSCGHTHSFGKWTDYGSYQARECEECGYIEREYFDGEKSNSDISADESSEKENNTPGTDSKDTDNELIVCTRIDVTFAHEASETVFPKYYIFEYDDMGNQTGVTAYDYRGSEKYHTAGTSFPIHTLDDSSLEKYTNVRQDVENGLKVEYRDVPYNDRFNRYDRWKIVFNADGTPHSEMLQPASTALAIAPDGGYEYFYDNDGRLTKMIQYAVSFSFSPEDSTPEVEWYYPEFETFCTYKCTYQTFSQYLAQKEANHGSVVSSGKSNSGNSSGGVSPKTCPACLGNKSNECSGCDGKGKVLSYYDINHNPVYSTCPICHGSGSVSCKVCGGDGTIYD